MKRQWDTKKQFKASYRSIAKNVLFLWFREAKKVPWRREISDIGHSVSVLAGGVFLVSLYFVIALLFPVVFPALCVFAKKGERKNRLDYIRINRAADRDV